VGQDLRVTVPTRSCIAGGTVDALTGTTSPAAPSLTNQLRVLVELAGANATTTPTFNLDGLGAKTIVKEGDVALAVGDMPGANARADLVFDGSLDKWILLNPEIISKIQDGRLIYVVDTGAADVYVGTLAPAITAYTEGSVYRMKITNASTIIAPTVNFNAVGAKTIKRQGGMALVVNDLPAGYLAEFYYDGTDMILLNPWVGQIVQVVHTQDGAVATGTTVLPYDDSTPQNTEGDQYMALSITPRRTTNRLIIVAQVFLATSTATTHGVSSALFQDATAGALAVAGLQEGAAGRMQPLLIRYEMAAGTISATTFKIRGGGSAADTTTFNGASGVRKFEGVLASTITITEMTA
jgi:hypothetical protein